MLRRTFVLLLLVAVPAMCQTTPQQPLDLLKAKLQTIAHGVSADWGIYIKSLDTGEHPVIKRLRGLS